MFKNLRLLSAISLIGLIGASLIVPISGAQAADPCLADKIDVSAFSVHPGQKSGISINGSPITTPCVKDDLAYMALTYGPRTSSTFSSGAVFTSLTSWKWKNLTYEDYLALIKEAGITDSIDAQSVLGISFYSVAKGGAKKNADGSIELDVSKRIDFGIVLDPTPSGPCHPDKVSLTKSNKFEKIYKGSDYIQILNGVPTSSSCTEKDPGWLLVLYGTDGKTITNTYFAYQPDWFWGGAFSQDWFKDTLVYATPPVTDFAQGAVVEIRFWRSSDSTLQPDASTEGYNFSFGGYIDSNAAPVIAKSKSITCVKGKTTKKVSGANPKCPTGYKKK
ncbi:MAG: hypothetical protein ACR2I6_02125 [Candidatus Planktophila sp.]